MSSPVSKPESGAALSKNKEIKKLLDMGVQRGFLTYIEVNELLPPEFITTEQIDEVMNLLAETEIEVIDSQKRAKESDETEEGRREPWPRQSSTCRRRRRRSRSCCRRRICARCGPCKTLFEENGKCFASHSRRRS